MDSQAEGDCVIKADDPRLAGQTVEFHLNNMKCRLRMESLKETDTRRTSVYETPKEKGKYAVYAAICVTNEKLLLDVKRADKDTEPKQYLCISYRDELFKELVLEFSTDPRNCQLSFVLPEASRFLGQTSSELGVNEKASVTVYMSTPKAPDVAMYVNGAIKCLLGDDCSIGDKDPRLADQKVAFLLNSMKCRLQVEDTSSGGKRSSVYGTPDAPSRHTVFAALALTEQKIILDVKWLKEDATSKQYLFLNYEDKLCCDLGLEYTNDQVNSHLVITLPNAGQFLGPSISDLGVVDNSTVKIFVDTWKAPDLVMFVKQKLRKIHGASRASFVNPQSPAS